MIEAEIKLITGAGTLSANAVVTVSGKIRVHGYCVFEKPGQHPSVSSPAKSYETKDGKKKWLPIVEVIDPELKRQIEQAVLTAYARAKAERQSAPATSSQERWW